MQRDRGTLTVDDEVLVYELDVNPRKNAVILHGAGQAQRQRYYALADALTRRGIGVVLFDFSGHGESSGHLRELSLARRVAQARTIVDRLVPQESELYLLGFSMSGQTVCDLLPIYGARIKAIMLGAPGMYTREVHDLPFGSEAFTETIRLHESWRESDAPAKLAEFDGKTVIVIGDQDEVIPRGVIDLLKTHAKRLAYHELTGVKHQLASALSERPDVSESLLDDLIK